MRSAVLAGVLALGLLLPQAARAWIEPVGRPALDTIASMALFGLPPSVTPEMGGMAVASGLRLVDPYALWLRVDDRAPIGKYGFIAASANGRYIAKPRAGGAFARAGIVDAIEIVAVEGRSLSGIGLPAANKIVESLPDSALFHLRDLATGRIRLRRIRRTAFHPRSVEVTMRDDMVFVALHDLTLHTSADLAEHRAALESGLPVVLDLRYNVGGEIGAAVNALSIFAGARHAGTPVLNVRGRDGVSYDMRAVEPVVSVPGPVYILASGATASAAEIVIASLSALGRARIVGETTFGKCLAQETLSLPDGDLVLSVAELTWMNRAGCDGNGLVPDVQVGPSDIHRTRRMLAIVLDDLASASRNAGWQIGTVRMVGPGGR